MLYTNFKDAIYLEACECVIPIVFRLAQNEISPRSRKIRQVAFPAITCQVWKSSFEGEILP